MTLLLERDSERIEDQTVDLPVQQIETENLRWNHGRSSGAPFQAHRRAVWWWASFASHEGDLWNSALFPQEGSQQYTAEEHEVQPLIMEEIVEVVRLAPQEQISERICEQIMEVSVSQERTAYRSGQDLRPRPNLAGAVEQIIDVPRPRPFGKTVEQTDILEMCKSFHLSACSSVVWSSLSIWQLRASWEPLLKWCDWFLRSAISSARESTLSIFLNNRSRKRSSRRSTRISRRGDTDWRLSPSVTCPRGDAGWILTPSVLSWRGGADWRLTPRMLGRRRTSCNAGTESAFRRIQEPAGVSSEPRKS